MFALGERVIVLDGGRVIATGTPHEVIDLPVHETIAQQWRLLAEVIETGPAPTKPPIANGRDILTSEAKSDATPDSPDARRIEHLDDQILETDDLVEQISSGTEEREYPDQILENDRCVATVSPDAKDVGALDDQVS